MAGSVSHHCYVTRFIQLCLLLCAVLVLTACEQHDSPHAGPVYADQPLLTESVYRLAVHPLHNPKQLVAAYQPLIDYLNSRSPGVRFEIEASRDYQRFEEKFQQRQPHWILPNPWQTLEAMKVGYRVIAMAGEADDFKGIFIVRRDSDISQPADLKGRAVSYPSPTALAACIMPQQYLHDHGINVNTDIENRYVGSQESSIMNALLGEVAVAATWPPPWRLFQKQHPDEAAKLKVIWQTPPLMNNSVMVRDDIPADLAHSVQSILVSLHETDEGQKILKAMETARFYSADNDSYAPVREFVRQFEQQVRKVTQP